MNKAIIIGALLGTIAGYLYDKIDEESLEKVKDYLANADKSICNTDTQTNGKKQRTKIFGISL